MIGNKSANRITKVSKNSQQNKLEIVKNGHDKELPKERYVSQEERQEIIDELTLKQCGNDISKNHNKTIQKKLQMRTIKKYLKKNIYLQKKDRKLLII